MGSYIPNTLEEQREMLEAVGVGSMAALYSSVPAQVMLDRLDLPAGKAELEVREIIEGMAVKNKVFGSVFRGAGAYNHYIPAIVKSITSKEEFITNYTPYQAELAQGPLQALFEYQTMISELTGMAVSNSSVYDGASAAAEGLAMCKDRKRLKMLVSQTAHPMTKETIATYCEGSDTPLALVPMGSDGRTDLDALKTALDDGIAGVYIQQPNFYGLLEDIEAVVALVKAAGAKVVVGINPIAAVLLKTPGECGADIAVGEGQPLGIPMGFGGPYLGFMTCTKELMRKMPGRIVGQTVDLNGNRAFVLTLQAREQHIRREKASSNICSNQALCAMTAGVYLSAMGPQGMRQVAESCLSKAHYAANGIGNIPGFNLRYSGEFFHEFITECPIDPHVLISQLAKKDILGGYPVEGGILWCVTELNSKKQIDRLVEAIKEVSGK